MPYVETKNGQKADLGLASNIVGIASMGFWIIVVEQVGCETGGPVL